MLASAGPSAAPLLVELGLVAAAGIGVLVRHAVIRALGALSERARSRRLAARRQVGRA
jgi:hypothetical protein